MRRRVWFAVWPAVIVAMSVASAIGQAYADPFAMVKYELFHWETDAWVEYYPADPLPTGGDEPGTNLWKYEYVAYNWGAPQPIQQIYVFFNSENVAMDATWAGDTTPAGWVTSQIGPFDPDFNWKIWFMALGSAYYIQTADSLEGLAVEFTWTSPVLPGNQPYDAVYSGGSEAGTTIHREEPTALAPASWGGIKSLYR